MVHRGHGYLNVCMFYQCVLHFFTNVSYYVVLLVLNFGAEGIVCSSFISKLLIIQLNAFIVGL